MKRERITTLALVGLALLNFYGAMKSWSVFTAASGSDVAEQMMSGGGKSTATWNLVIFGAVIIFSIRNIMNSFGKFNKVFWSGFAAWGILSLLLYLGVTSLTVPTYYLVKALLSGAFGIGLSIMAVWQYKDGTVLW